MPKRRKNIQSKSKKRASFFRRLSISALFLVVGLALIGASLGLRYYKERVLSFAQEYPVAVEELQGSAPAAISIPDLAIELDIIPSRIVNGVWEINPDGVSFLSGSANPGTNGNIVLYGHNKRGLLGNLKNARNGQKIRIVTSDGIVRTYEIQDITTVNPDNIEVLSPTSEETLTLYTCTGLFDSKRLVVKAIPWNY